MNHHLLIIDPQNDFCDLPDTYRPFDALGAAALMPSLPVTGAHADLLRVANLIDAGRAGLSGITVTLDSHHRLDIAHPTFWMTAGHGAVAPFTEISAADARAGRYLPRNGAARARVLAYLDALEAAGRYKLMVWPVHCEMGSWGHNIHAAVLAACHRWEDASLGSVNLVAKGENPWTEHYSAFQAEVPDPTDPGTLLNTALLATLAQADRVYICGEAGSHCVRASTEHLVGHTDPCHLSKLVLLTDCISPVTGFEKQQQDFFAAMAARGVQLASAATVLPALLDNI